MDSKKHKISVIINNQRYTLIGSEDPEHLRHVANLVDDKMADIASKAHGLDTTRKAVLAAVNIMDEYVKLKEAYEILKEDVERQG